MAEQIADDRQWQWRDGVTVHESGGKGVAASLPDAAHLAEIREMSAEIDRLRSEVDRLERVGAQGAEVGPPPFVLTPPSEELRPLYARLGLGPGEIGPTWKVIRTGVCPQCRGKLDGQGGDDDPWRQCAPCALDWAAEWDVFGVREV
jgi:hypothetical protein